MRRLSIRRPRPPHQSVDPAKRGAHASIARRLRWSYLVSSTLPLIIVGALLLTISSQALQSNVYAEQQGVATRVGRDISGYVAGLQTAVAQFGLQVRPATPTDNQVEAAETLLSNNNPNLLDLAVLDNTGRERLRVSKLLKVPDNELISREGDPDVQRALREGKRSYSTIAPNADGVPAFVLTLPLPNDSGTIVGALRAEISAEPIMRELREATTSSGSYAYLVNRADGAVLLDDGAPGFAQPPELGALLAAQQGTAEYAGARDQDVIGTITPVLVGDDDTPTGWAVVAERPADEAFGWVRRSVLLLTGLVLLVVALALFWAFRQARHILRPLQALRDGAMALGDGQLDHRIAPLGEDEMGDLAQTFNQMAAHLQQSLDEIEQQNDRLRRGLALARDIQIGLLPDRPPWSADDLAVYGRSIPAYEVGGDFYSYLALPEGRAAIAIGDISGKGVGAALLMALTSSAVESQGREIEHPAKVLTALNNLLAPRLRANHMNAALLFAVFDPHSQTLRVANAGMISPVLVSSQGSQYVEAGGLPLGSFAGAIYQEVSVELHHGDTVLLVSDGVVEAHNAQGELFSFERLEATIAEAAVPGDVRALVELVIERVQVFMGDAEQHDDITIVAVRPLVVANAPLEQKDSIRYATV
jgi:serine phosphatase RsbU (regulator of sigma subunit)